MKKILLLTLLLTIPGFCLRMTAATNSYSNDNEYYTHEIEPLAKDSTKAPRLLELPSPLYPAEAKNRNIEGRVYIRILVGKDGKAKTAKVIKSDNVLFNKSAAKAALNAKFEPATINGDAIEESIVVTISFELKTKEEKLYDSALSSFKSSDYNDAISVLNNIIQQNSNYSEAYWLRGKCFEQKGQYESARLDFRRAISLELSYPAKKNKYDEDLSILLDKWYPELDKKIDLLLKEVAKDTSKANNYLEIGKLYLLHEYWGKAEQWYDEYLKREMKATADEIIRYSNVLTKTRSIAKGEKLIKKYINIYPDDWRLLSRYGYFSLWMGNLETAKKTFEAALRIKPFFKEAQDGLDIINRTGF